MLHIEQQRIVAETRLLEAKFISEQAKYAVELAALPGITVNEVRRALGFADHPEDSVGDMTLNLPA